MQRRASAQWRGGLKDGKGTVSTASGAVKNVAYSFAMRFGDEPGTNPESWLPPPMPPSFPLAFWTNLVQAGTHPNSSKRKRRLTLAKTHRGWQGSRSNL